MADVESTIARDQGELGTLESWNAYSKRILRTEMTKRGITYNHLTCLLQALGLDETEKSVTLKITRGSFRFTFFTTAMAAMGASSFTMTIPKLGEGYPDILKKINEDRLKK